MKPDKPGPTDERFTTTQVLSLLDNTKFCEDARACLTQVVTFAGSTNNADEVSEFLQGRVRKFIEQWGVPPPTAAQLISPHTLRAPVTAIASGRWGLVPIFAWTQDRQIKAAVREIRRTVKKQHRDAENTRRAQLARWLDACGFSRADIAKAVWNRKRGLHRPSRSEAIRRVTEVEERALLQQYLDHGLPHGQAEQRLYRRLQGSEAKATAAIRMANKRYVNALESINANLAEPVSSEPVSHAVTLLLRAAADDVDLAEIRRCIAAVKHALIAAPAR